MKTATKIQPQSQPKAAKSKFAIPSSAEDLERRICELGLAQKKIEQRIAANKSGTREITGLSRKEERRTLIRELQDCLEELTECKIARTKSNIDKSDVTRAKYKQSAYILLIRANKFYSELIKSSRLRPEEKDDLLDWLADYTEFLTAKNG